ncbi:MAG TPA: hypothetical protein VGX28_16915 [Frankiaceae bacterium]|jgi:hypothetical protein|nr:hypothetical protein [Frankiaceae bacterium]
MRWRTALVSLCSVVALTPPGATAAPAVPLAGRTTIAAPAAAGQVVVQVPRNVSLPGVCTSAPEVAVTGTAAFVAVVLVPTPYKAGDVDVIFGRLPNGRTFDTVCTMGERRLAAGSYLLTVVHTPGTASVTLALPGIGGRRSLSGLRGVPATAAVLPAFGTPADVKATTGAWGAEGTLARQGLTATVTWLSGSLDAAVFGDCIYPPDAPAGGAPPPLRYAPGCPAGQVAMSWAVRSRSAFFASSALVVPPGSYGLGAWYTVPAGAVTDGGTVGLWVPLA